MTNYRPTQSGLSFLYDTLVQYQAPGFFLCAAAVFLILAAVTGGKRMRGAFFYPLLVLAATVFNPFIFPALLSMRSEMVEQYYAFLWAVPVTLIIGGGAACVIFLIKNPAVRVLAASWIFVLLALLGGSYFGDIDTFAVASMPEKSDEEIVSLCDYITSHAATDSPYVAFDSPQTATEAMMHDASIRVSDLIYRKGGVKAGPLQEDYIVTAQEDEDTRERVREHGYAEVARTENFVICVRQG